MKKKLAGLFLLLTLALITACSSGYGNKVTGGNLTVFFADRANEEKATQLAEYWREKKLTGNRAQSIRLLEGQQSYHLYLIASNPDEILSLPPHERQLLIDLQQALNETLFRQKPCALYISDTRFKPIIKVNDL